jgi:hypothetical protein
MAPTPFSTDDDQWPLVAALTWIATRSLKFTEAFASREIDDADALLALAREGGDMPPGVTLGKAFDALCREIDANKIPGLARTAKSVVRREQEQDARIPRNDILRLWPDWPCVTAWKKAKTQAWRPPTNLSPDWLNNFSRGQYVSAAEVVDLLAFGPDRASPDFNKIEEMAARFRAGRALAEAAQSVKVTLVGRPAFRLPHHRNGGFVDGVADKRPIKIDPASCADLTVVIDGERDWLGPTRYADEYPERGQSIKSVTFIDVTVHRESLRRWLAELADKAGPRKRGRRPKFDWAAIEAEAARLMDHHGDFSPDDEWNAQARLEEKLLEYCVRQFSREPSLTQIRTRVRSFLNRW